MKRQDCEYNDSPLTLESEEKPLMTIGCIDGGTGESTEVAIVRSCGNDSSDDIIQSDFKLVLR